MKSVIDIAKLLDWFTTKESHNSEFLCSVCGELFYRDIAEEVENLTFNTGKLPIANSLTKELETGLVWTCSDRCRVTYTLQKV